MRIDEPVYFEEILVDYDCMANDNSIKIRKIQNTADAPMVLDELLIGCKDVPSDGWSVIGYEDLKNALNLVGYDIVYRGTRC